MTVNQEDGRKGETDSDLTASTDVFFLSPEDSCSQEEAPILIRKRKALRSLSHEPVKRSRSHDDPAGSLPLSESVSHLSPPRGGGRVPSARATRSLTPNHYIVWQQQMSRVEPLEETSTVQQSVPESASKSATDVYSLSVPPMQKEGVSKAGMDETERGVGEQIQTSSDAPEQKSPEEGLAYFLSMGEGDKTSMDTERDSKQSPAKVLHDEKSTKEVDQGEAMDYTSQAEPKDSPKASHSEEKKAVMMEQSVTETQAISTTGSQEKAASRSSKSETAKSTTAAKVTSPRRYSTRRQGIAQGSTVEKLTQNYTARLEQALGSPDAQKKKPLALQSQKRTPKGAKASPKVPVKSGGGKISRRSRGSARGKTESEGGGGEGEKEETEKGEGERGGGGDDEGVIGGADSRAVSEPSTPQVVVEKQGEYM